jgi:hypothetical protein
LKISDENIFLGKKNSTNRISMGNVDENTVTGFGDEWSWFFVALFYIVIIGEASRKPV